MRRTPRATRRTKGTKGKTTFLIVSDDPSWSSGTWTRLPAAVNVAVVDNLDVARSLIQAQHAGVACTILDLDAKRADLLAAMQEISEALPNTPGILVRRRRAVRALGTFEVVDAAEVRARVPLLLGRALALKATGSEHIADAIFTLAEKHELTVGQMHLLALSTTGLSRRAVCDELCIGVDSLKTRLRLLFKELDLGGDATFDRVGKRMLRVALEHVVSRLR